MPDAPETQNSNALKVKIKEHIVSVLVITSLILFFVFVLVTKVFNNIVTVNNLYGAIGILTLVPLAIGLFIYGGKIKGKKPILSQILRFYSVIYIVAFIVCTIYGLVR